jgi:hypothetical protein
MGTITVKMCTVMSLCVPSPDFETAPCIHACRMTGPVASERGPPAGPSVHVHHEATDIRVQVHAG